MPPQACASTCTTALLGSIRSFDVSPYILERADGGAPGQPAESRHDDSTSLTCLLNCTSFRHNKTGTSAEALGLAGYALVQRAEGVVAGGQHALALLGAEVELPRCLQPLGLVLPPRHGAHPVARVNPQHVTFSS